MFSPTDPDRVFFCHEGNTFYVSNRLWLYTKEKAVITGQEPQVLKARTPWTHPCHSHPSFNLDSSRLIFRERRDEHVMLGLIRMTDLVKQGKRGYSYENRS